MVGAVRAPSRGTRLATRSLTKRAFGPPTRPKLGLRFEKTQNFVSTNDPEVVESRRASCNGIGMFMTGVVTTPIPDLFEI